MATWNLYCPSQAGSYSTPAGDVQLIITFEGSGAGGSVDFDSPAWFASKLNFDFSMQSDGKVRLSTLKLGFENRDDIWETFQSTGVFALATDPEKVFVKIILNSATFWQGIVDYSNIEKTDYYNDGGALKYGTIIVPFVDRVRALEFYTLDDAGISTGDSVATVLSAMASQIDLTLGSTLFSFSFTEIGGKGYNPSGAGVNDPLKLLILHTDINCMTYLKRLARAFGFYFYTSGTNLNIVSRDTTVVGALDPITNEYRMRKIGKQQTIKYVGTIGTKSWDDMIEPPGPYLNLPKNDTMQFSSGEESPNTAQNFVLDLTDIFKNVYGELPASGQVWAPSTSHNPASASDPADRPGEILVVNAGGVAEYDDSGFECESGMIAQVNFSDKTKKFYTVITHWETNADRAYIRSHSHVASDIDTGEYFNIVRREPGTWWFYEKLFKIYPCLKTVTEIYAKHLLGDKALRIFYPQFETVGGGFSYDGDNYMHIKMEYDFSNGECMADAIALYASPTVELTEIIQDAATLNDNLNDGQNKITAKQASDHIIDDDVHLQKTYDGTNYFKMSDTDGDDHYVHIKKLSGRKAIFISPEKPD